MRFWWNWLTFQSSVYKLQWLFWPLVLEEVTDTLPCHLRPCKARTLTMNYGYRYVLIINHTRQPKSIVFIMMWKCKSYLDYAHRWQYFDLQKQHTCWTCKDVVGVDGGQSAGMWHQSLGIQTPATKALQLGLNKYCDFGSVSLKFLCLKSLLTFE